MPWGDYEQLNIVGLLDWNWSITKGYDQLHFKKPGNYVDPSINTGHSQGYVELALQFDYLPKSGLTQEFLDALWSRCDYLFIFFCASKEAGNKPFWLECHWPGTRDKKKILVRFAEDKLTLAEIATRMFSAGSVPFEQVRVEGDDGGPEQDGQFENPFQM